jgi:hypothetical protein
VGASAAIPLAALFLSTGALVLAVLQNRTGVRHQYLVGLEARVEKLETDLAACCAERERLAAENIRLLRQLFEQKGV